MAIGVTGLLNMGKGALFANQAAIQTTGNNISNVNTPGYSRQAVRLEENYALDYYPGQVGQGVHAKEIIRYFDQFIEKSYLEKLSSSWRQSTKRDNLTTVESLFNESNINNIGKGISAFFNGWAALGRDPEGTAPREALLQEAQTLTTAIRNADESMRVMETMTNDMLQQDVNSANKLISEIAALNKEIAASYIEGRNNPNELMDQRDRKVRELSTLVDVDVLDRGPRDYVVVTKSSGCVLVDQSVGFSFQFQGPQAYNDLTANSSYKEFNSAGNPLSVQFQGQDSHEYTLEVVKAGTIGAGAQFRVSIDGGKTWMTDDAGNERHFNANETDNQVRVGKLDIWFDSNSNASKLDLNDRFVISPKSDIYWISPTKGPMNVSTQIMQDGTANPDRLVGGTLAGTLEFRDYYLGEYRDRLDSLSKTLAWEVNRIHSQGAGLTPFTTAFGTYRVGNTTAALGSPEARFAWSDKLQAGNMTFAVYDVESGKPLPLPPATWKPLDVLPDNFDPAKHSMQDVVNAINSKAGTFVKAEIVDNKLKISSTDPNKFSFAITADTTGLAAAFGINTFFEGDSAASLAVNGPLMYNSNLVNSGRLNGAGEINLGDNQTARELADLAQKSVSIGTIWHKATNQTIGSYYAALSSKVGSDTRSAKYTAATEGAMAKDLFDRQEEVSGVNLDEEMSSLIKFQASYKAAAKLITTADEMLQTLLSLKQ